MAQISTIDGQTLSSGSLNSETFGSEHSTHLVFLHGWGLNSSVWESIAASLSQRYRVTLIDLPGFGFNHEYQLTPYSIPQVVELLAEKISQPAILVGWSLGGLVASQLALTYPERVTGLITVTSSPCFVAKAGWPGIETAVLGSFHQQLVNGAEQTIDTFLKIQAMGSPHIRQDIKRMHELVMSRPQPNAETLNNSLNLLEQVDLRDRLKEINQPFFRLYGRLDSLVPKAAIEEIAKLAPMSEQAVMEKASHAPFISHEQEFTAVLIRWLEKHFS